MMCPQDRKKVGALVRRVKQELQALEKLSRQLAVEPDHAQIEHALELASARLQCFYKRCERILYLLRGQACGIKAQGVNWRHCLLREAAQGGEGAPPPVISMITREELNRLLVYRNRVKNIYGYQPAPHVVSGLALLTAELYSRFARELEHYRTRLVQSGACNPKRGESFPN